MAEVAKRTRVAEEAQAAARAAQAGRDAALSAASAARLERDAAVRREQATQARLAEIQCVHCALPATRKFYYDSTEDFDGSMDGWDTSHMVPYGPSLPLELYCSVGGLYDTR